MPPKSKKKDGASKKNEQKKKEKSFDDKTFGLKNKNKSKKVQDQVNSIKHNVYNTGTTARTRQDDMKKKAAKTNAKLKKKAAKAEQDALFGEALMAVKTKTSTSGKAGAVEAKGRDHDDKEEKSGTSRAMKMMFQMDAQEMEEKLKEDPNYVPTLEDEIESQRQAMVESLKKSGKKGTPVTPETFKVWQDKKRKRRVEEIKKKVDVELRKKKGGKGLAVLSGRDLYEYKRELFVDRDTTEDGISEVDGIAEANSSKRLSDDLGDLSEGKAKMPVGTTVDAVAEKIDSDLFLVGDDEDLDDLDDLDD